MDEFFSGILELLLDFVTDKFECIQNRALRLTVQIIAIIVTCALVLAVFFGVYRLLTR